MSRRSPIDPFIEKQGLLLLYGGLATELEAQGFVLTRLPSRLCRFLSPLAAEPRHEQRKAKNAD